MIPEALEATRRSSDVTETEADVVARACRDYAVRVLERRMEQIRKDRHSSETPMHPTWDALVSELQALADRIRKGEV
jgi:hypothetical protein